MEVGELQRRSGWRIGSGRQEPILFAGAVCAGYTGLAVATTWPLVRDFGSKIAGDELDPVQTLWGFWWWRTSVESGAAPFWTSLLWWPEGVPMWFQTWDIPFAAAVVPLWGVIPDVAIYNLALFATFPLSGVACYWLCREVWGGNLVPFLCGALYSFSTFHYAAATANLHMASMHWSPLYFLGLIRVIRAGSGGPCIAAGGLALATMASIYHLVFCAAGTLVIICVCLRADLLSVRTRGLVGRAAVTVGLYIGLCGWLLAGMMSAYVAESYLGSHPARMFSADAQSFAFPNAPNALINGSEVWRSWVGSRWSTGSYLGYISLSLAITGMLRSRLARAHMAMAGVGAVLALGPVLHVGGTPASQIPLPYAWCSWLLPPLDFGGIPSRFTWLTVFGVSVAAGASLRAVANRRWGRVIACALATAAIVETWPKAMPMTALERPIIMERWAREGGDWAVLDMTYGSRPLWHQMMHRRPIVGGYTTRVPARLVRESAAVPAVNLFADAGVVPAPWPGHVTQRLRPVASPLPASAVRARQVQDALGALDIRFVVVEASMAAVPASLGLVELEREGRIVIYGISEDEQ